MVEGMGRGERMGMGLTWRISMGKGCIAVRFKLDAGFDVCNSGFGGLEISEGGRLLQHAHQRAPGKRGAGRVEKDFIHQIL